MAAADATDSLILDFIRRRQGVPVQTSVVSAVLVGSVGSAAAVFERDPAFGKLASISRVEAQNAVQALIRRGMLRCDHDGLKLPPSVGGLSLAAATVPDIRAGVKRPLSALVASAGSGGFGGSSVKAASSTSATIDSKSSPTFVSTESCSVGAGAGSVSAAACARWKLTAEQAAVFRLVVDLGRSVFFSGAAGCGKSHLLRAIIESLREKYARDGLLDACVVTAPTGIAACAIGGSTVHSFAGISAGGGDGGGSTCRSRGGAKDAAEAVMDAREEMAVQVGRKVNGAARRWKACRTLIIDEVSMLDGETLDLLEHVARRVRHNEAIFGGVQLVLSGDFLQLPPIGLSGGGGGGGGGGVSFAFEAACWRRALYAQVNLSQAFRQRDPAFLALLNEVRTGVVSSTSHRLLSREFSGAASSGPATVQPTRLFAMNRDLDALNNRELARCSAPDVFFDAVDVSADGVMLAALQRSCPATGRLALRVDAQVMLLKNIDAERGLVNGARGVVVGFVPNREPTGPRRLPQVLFANGVYETVGPREWTLAQGSAVLASRTQVPLKLAWGISMHKSQGMTIDILDVDMAGVFEFGQAYVALSRAVSLDRLRVFNFSPSVVRAHPRALAFYRSITAANGAPPPLKPLPPLPNAEAARPPLQPSPTTTTTLIASGAPVRTRSAAAAAAADEIPMDEGFLRELFA